MKSELFLMHFLPRIVRRESILFFTPRLFRFDYADSFYNISHNHRESDKNALSPSVIIKFMKKFILSALLPLVYFLYTIFPLATFAVQPPKQRISATAQTAASGYACILTDDVFFYPTRDEKRGLFLLPKTYYVKVLETSPDFCKIEYLYDDTYVKKLTGYARTSDLTFVDYIPERPYLYYLFEVQYRIDETVLETDGFLNELTVTCAYYGDYKIGSELYCYVLRGDSFGYIPKPTNISYEENPEYAEHVPPTETSPPTDTKEQSDTSSPAQIAILIALCLLVPVLAALILKPPRRPPYETDEQ